MRVSRVASSGNSADSSFQPQTSPPMRCGRSCFVRAKSSACSQRLAWPWHCSVRTNLGAYEMLKKTVLNGMRSGAISPLVGGFAHARVGAFVAACMCSIACTGCSGKDDEKRSLEPIQLGMTSDLDPVYDMDELKLYEVKR